MLVTHSPEGHLRARPMAVARIEDDCSMWFITSPDSSKTLEIGTNANVLIVCQNDYRAYLSMSGQAAPVHDRAKISELWQEPFKVWFPSAGRTQTSS